MPSSCPPFSPLRDLCTTKPTAPEFFARNASKRRKNSGAVGWGGGGGRGGGGGSGLEGGEALDVGGGARDDHQVVVGDHRFGRRVGEGLPGALHADDGDVVLRTDT